MSKVILVNVCPETSACWGTVNVRVIHTADALCGSYAFQHNFQLRRTEVSTLSKFPGFTRISWQTFSSRCCNTRKPFIGAEYTKVFRCFHSQKSRWLTSGDHAGQLTGPPRPTHCPPKVRFRCSLIMRRKWYGAPSCMIHMCCWWRGTCSKSTGKSFTKERWYTAPVSLLDKTTGYKSWSPKVPTQILTHPYLSRHWFLDTCWLGLFAHLSEYYTP
jgi:hypothetical protein